MIKRRKYLKQKRMVQRLKNMLLKCAGIDKDHIDVLINKDTIILDGTVNTLAQKADAEEIVHSIIKGQHKIDNNLRISTEYAGAEVYEY
jgi:osmotically-inducible protein OsmY